MVPGFHSWDLFFYMKTCLIISGGEFSPIPADKHFDYIIACDLGILYAQKLNRKPDLIVGDFDSLSSPIPPEYADIPIQTFPVEKDDSDTMLAIRIALKKGYKKISIICALGGRLDHTFANLQALGFIASHGAIGELYAEDTYVLTHTDGTVTLPKREGFSLSLFACSNTCEDITITGSAYDVSHVNIENTFPIGLSNYWKQDAITISMKKGILFIMLSRYKTTC